MPVAEQQKQITNEALGLAMLGAGTLLFLSLISYEPKDVPSWFPLHSVGTPNRHTLNFIGPFGAIVACIAYSFLGAAAYLLPALLLGYGALKLLAPSLQLRSQIIWAATFALSAACLLDLFGFTLIDAHKLNISGEGGWLGKWIGSGLFAGLLGKIGALLIISAIYLLSLVLMVGADLETVIHHTVRLSRSGRDALLHWWQERSKPAPPQQLELTPEPQPKPRRKSEKSEPKTPAQPKASDSGQDPTTPAPATTPSENFALRAHADETAQEPQRPPPKIIDSNIAQPAKPRPEKKKATPQAMAAVACENYEIPSIELLDPVDLSVREAAKPEELLAIQDLLIETLAQFNVSVSRGDITRGPTVTRFELYPAKGVPVRKIKTCEDDLARATSAERINILAPVPGKDTVGVEIANSKKQKVTLRELLESEDYAAAKAKIPIALGKDVYGKTIIADLAAMPHGLVAGATGSGKSVCINSIIASLLYRFTPEDLRLIMIDPKVVEMQMYNTLPHLVIPVVTDPKKVLLALRWAVDEMERRYAIFSKTNVRNITSFNNRPKPKTQKQLDAENSKEQPATPDPTSETPPWDPQDSAPPPAAATPSAAPDPAPIADTAEHEDPADSSEAEEPEEIDFSSMEDDDLFKVAAKPKIFVPRDADELIIPDRMPYIVIIIDELADLMQTAPADVESAIARITQKARAAGLHMIIATQTPRAEVVTGVIKANVPCRMAFQVSSALDSRVILDDNGAEGLLGQGDMLYRPPGAATMVRIQGVLVTDEEVQRVVDHCSSQSTPSFENSIHKQLQSATTEGDEEVSDEDEELVEKCLEVVRQEKKASTSLFQRRLRLGYTRAARILDILESRGYVSSGEGAKPRELLRDLDAEP